MFALYQKMLQNFPRVPYPKITKKEKKYKILCLCINYKNNRRLFRIDKKKSFKSFFSFLIDLKIMNVPTGLNKQ